MREKAMTEQLVDLRDVHIDAELPTEEKIRSFLQQIKDPYCYKVGDVVVRVAYTETDRTLDDCVAGIISAM